MTDGSARQSFEPSSLNEEAMKEQFEYRGYVGTVEIDLDANLLCGHVVNTNDCLVYEAETLAQLRESFESLVDEYIEEIKNELV